MRERIRCPLSATGKVNDNTDVNVRLATGSADPVSTNQTLDGGFTSKALWVDHAYYD
jgi:hypothetical protein